MQTQQTSYAAWTLMRHQDAVEALHRDIRMIRDMPRDCL